MRLCCVSGHVTRSRSTPVDDCLCAFGYTIWSLVAGRWSRSGSRRAIAAVAMIAAGAALIVASLRVQASAMR
jgi:hypothetical protein